MGQALWWCSSRTLKTVLTTADGGYLLAGRSDSGISGDRTQVSQGSTDYWIVKVSASGGANLIASARIDTEQIEEESVENMLNLRAHPNPFTEKLNIDFTLLQTAQVNLKVYDSQGTEVKTLFEGEAEKDKAYEFEWKVSSEKPGFTLSV